MTGHSNLQAGLQCWTQGPNVPPSSCSARWVVDSWQKCAIQTSFFLTFIMIENLDSVFFCFFFTECCTKFCLSRVLADLSRFRPVYAPKDFLEVSARHAAAAARRVRRTLRRGLRAGGGRPAEPQPRQR